MKIVIAIMVGLLIGYLIGTSTAFSGYSCLEFPGVDGSKDQWCVKDGGKTNGR